MDPGATVPRKIGLVGAGTVGTRIGVEMMEAGHSLIVHDVRRDFAAELLAHGAVWAERPAEVAAHAEVVFSSVPGPREVEAIFLGPGGLLEAVRADHVFFDLTTSSPETSRKVARACEAHGAAFFDAPLTYGGEENSISESTLTVLVGGPKEILQENVELFEPFADQIFHLGPVGTGNVVKLINNLMAIVNRSVAAEALVLGTRAGADPSMLFRCVRTGSGNSWVFEGLESQVLTGDFNGGFSVDLATKDLRLALELAEQVGLKLRFTPAVYAFHQDAQAQGLGGESDAAVIQVIEREANVEVRARKDRKK